MQLSKKSNSNIIEYKPQKFRLNIGMVVFFFIFIYILICIFIYLTTKHIIGYEVKAGSLYVSNVYTGVALRDEEVVTATEAGYVNYFAREGERVGFGNLVYTIDESGKISEMLQTGELGENTLDENDLVDLKEEIIGFCNTYDSEQFENVYSFKYDLDGTILKYSNNNILQSIDLISNSDNSLVNLCTASKPGLVVYNTDGMEELTADQINDQTFNMETYTKNQLLTNNLVSTGDPVYKMILSEMWSLVIPLDDVRAKELAEETYVEVKFLKNQNTSWANISVFQNEDQYYAKLDFNSSVITFCKDRFVEIEILTEDDIGLKIPNSAIVEKEFFLVPIEYATTGKNENEQGFIKEVYTEEGEASSEFIAATISNKTDTDYYIDDPALSIGDDLIKPDSVSKYTLSKSGTLIGVYNINKGYADFKQVVILYQNDEYSIVKSDTTYGLSVYDPIVLDAQTVNEDDFIY